MEQAYLVAGAASGIGAATARRLAAPGIGLMLQMRSSAAGLVEVTAVIAFLASPAASSVAGQVRHVDGGLV